MGCWDPTLGSRETLLPSILCSRWHPREAERRVFLPPGLEEEERPLCRGGPDMSEASSCPGSETPAPGCRLGALYWACVRNDPVQLQAALDGGVSPEEAVQVDGNGRVSHPRCSPGQLVQL